VDRQILALLHRVTIAPELRELGQEVIREWKERETGLQREEEANLEREIEALERKREKLLDIKLGDLLSDAEYLEQKQKLGEQLSQRRVQLQLARENAKNSWDNLENTLALATYGALLFEGGEATMRALIAKTVGARYVLTHGSLAVEISPIFSPLCELKNASQTGSGSQDGGVSPSMRHIWWAILDIIRTMLLERNISIPAIAITKAK
jgi:hypothetical protein